MDHEGEERVAAAGERDGARFGMGQTSRRFIEEEVDHWPAHPCTADVECSDGQPYEEESDREVLDQVLGWFWASSGNGLCGGLC
jgi:hypothetical protein